MMRSPVAFRKASKVAPGSVSPADTHLRRLRRSTPAEASARLRYMVGEEKRAVQRCSVTVRSRTSGVALSVGKTVQAPKRKGKHRSPPRP